MDVFALTRAFIDIESVTGNELAIGQYFHDYLQPLADKHGGQAERIEVEKDRYNVYAQWGRPEIVFSTHLDTVPPFIPSREDAEFVWGRGACDTKGISASMIKASEALLEEGVRDFAMLFVVGEEIDGISFVSSTRRRGTSSLCFTSSFPAGRTGRGAWRSPSTADS